MNRRIYKILSIIALLMIIVQAPLFHFYITGLLSGILYFLYIIIGVLTVFFVLFMTKKYKSFTFYKLLNFVTLILGVFVFFQGSALMNKIDFKINREKRENLVKSIIQKEDLSFKNDTAWTQTIDKSLNIISSSNRLLVTKKNTNYKFQFYIDDGFLDHFSAFLYTNNPEIYSDEMIIGKKEKIENNWFYIYN